MKYRYELKVELIEVTIQCGKLRQLGHVTKIGEQRLARKIYESKEDEKGKGEGEGRVKRGWKN